MRWIAGKGEGRRLARAGRRFGEDVATLQQRRDRLPLDRRRLLVAQLGERGDQRTVDAQGVEFGLSGGNGRLAAIRDWAVGHALCHASHASLGHVVP